VVTEEESVSGSVCERARMEGEQAEVDTEWMARELIDDDGEHAAGERDPAERASASKYHKPGVGSRSMPRRVVNKWARWERSLFFA
jgi:hypothetical protein